LVPAGSSYRPATLRVEADWSGATVLLAAAAFLGVPATVPSLDLSSDQPDRAFAGMLRDLGMDVVASGDGVVASGTTRRGGTFDLRDTPDAACALAALGVLSPEPLRIEGAPHLRGKESDRIAGLVSALRAVGADAWERADGLEVGPGIRRPDARPPHSPVRLDIRGDHRLAMTAALLGLWRPVEFAGASCVAKSFPGFFGQWPGTR
jgi:3-phosphoshikimate 1-carboxyvinyltransferase